MTPAFPPNNAADCHRVRMALPYFKENGWEAEVLAIRPEFVEAAQEQELLQTVPPGIKIHRAAALPQAVTRLFGFGGLGLRAGRHLQKEGARLLREDGFDAVYFSSTVFSTFPMGIDWKRKFGIPFFIDYQDPWWSDYYENRGQTPPGGWFKYRLVQRSARQDEGRTIREAAGVTCVSPAYIEMLSRRYPDAAEAKFLEIPFGAPEKDFEVAGGPSSPQAPTLSTEELRRVGLGKEVWRYIGRGGPDMAASLRIFAAVLGQSNARQFHLDLAGTSYAAGSKAGRTMAPILEESLPKSSVEESPGRIGYLETLRKLKGASRLVLFGSDDPAYTASKLYNYILAQRPLLVICREESSVARIVRETKSAELITFGEKDVGLGGRIRIRTEWREAMGKWLAMDPAKEPPTDWKAFEPYTAKKMTEKLCRFFDQRLEAEKRRPSFAPSPSKAGGGASKGICSKAARSEKSKPKVLLVHPGIQHAPRLAEALEIEGMLARFWTGWAKAAGSQSQLGKRRVGIPAEKLKTLPWLEWSALFFSRTGIDPERVWHWRNRIFQNFISDKEIAEADVVIGFDTGSWILARKAREMGKKFILDQSIGHPAARISEMKKMGRAEETWSEPYQPRPGKLADWEKREHELAGRIVVGSRFTQNTLIGQGVPTEKIGILPYGVGEEFVAAGERRVRDRKEGKIRFLFLGQLAQRKGVQFLLEAWKGLPAGRSELVLMGGGARYRWRQMAGEGVIFRGQAGRRQVLEEMGRSDVLVLPSLFEGFGLVILEAMAAGLPVITTTNTGGPDVIEDGKEGFIIPAGNVKALREKMEYLIQNPGQAIRMGQAAHQKARQYTWERYGKAYAETIREVLRP